MKYIVMALAGSADQPCEELGGKTPFEVAKIPNLQHFAKIGRVGLVKLTPDRLDPASDANLLNLLGYDADKVYTGRGPLEAANMELKLDQNEIAFRMNFITEADGKLADPTSGHITTKEAKALINFLNKKVANDFVRFFAGSQFRHIAVLKDSHGYEALSAKTTCPEDIVWDPIEQHFPKGPGDELLKKLMYDAKLLLQDHEINQVRVDLGENPANMIWLWGQGPQPQVSRFSDLHGLSGALISNVEYAKGIGRVAGLTVIDIPNSSRSEEDPGRMARALMEAVEEKDFVLAYLPECDDAVRAGDLKAKISALESADFHILSKVKEYVERKKDARVVITSCHAALWKSRKHSREAVPFLMAGKNVTPDDVEKFSELTAKAAAVKISSGVEFLKYILSK